MTFLELQTISNFLSPENFVSTREIQKSPSRALTGVRVVTKNGKPAGFYFDKQEWEDLLEDFLASNSPSYLKKIEKARAETETFTREEIIKEFGLSV